MSRDILQHCGPWAVVTGASSGIGRAFAFALAERGFAVVLVARRGDALAAVADEIRSRHGSATRVIAVDLGEAGAAAAVIEQCAELDVGMLVAAAGFGSVGPLLERELADEANMVDVNCRAVLELTHAFGRRLVARGRGAIVLLSSVVAFQGAPRSANYAATKAYVQSLAEGLRLELAPRGVRVVACAPGPVESEFAARAGMRDGSAARPEVVANETLRRLTRATVRPGGLAKLLGWSLSLLPRAGRVRVMAKIMVGMARGASA
ncbi:MAG: SDR family NAD(P)-dependent oxidoreductase [Planctomycetes bacterium]|nr:SDR family NAD(P)-dependent oxidoreductase [Planctomycetota bacterium]